MTDLSKGIIDIEGFEVTPKTTQEAFEGYFKDNIEKTINRFDSSIVTFNKPINLSLNAMRFINLEVDFRNGRISKIELVSHLKPYNEDENGHALYAPNKEVECYEKMFEWASKMYGAPSFENFACWNYAWGSLNISKGDYSNRFSVEYGRNYTL